MSVWGACVCVKCVPVCDNYYSSDTFQCSNWIFLFGSTASSPHYVSKKALTGFVTKQSQIAYKTFWPLSRSDILSSSSPTGRKRLALLVPHTRHAEPLSSSASTVQAISLLFPWLSAFTQQALWRCPYTPYAPQLAISLLREQRLSEKIFHSSLAVSGRG